MELAHLVVWPPLELESRDDRRPVGVYTRKRHEQLGRYHLGRSSQDRQTLVHRGRRALQGDYPDVFLSRARLRGWVHLHGSFVLPRAALEAAACEPSFW